MKNREIAAELRALADRMEQAEQAANRQNRRIVFPAPGQVELENCSVPAPGHEDILIRNVVTVVSPGTELAHLHGPEWTDRRGRKQPYYPSYPGYMAAGIVENYGESVETFRKGNRVAYAGGHTAYGVTRADSEYLWRIPEGVSWEDAALTRLAVTALHGIEVGRDTAERRYGNTLVVGDGLLAQLVMQLLLAGGDRECHAITRHEQRARLMKASGAQNCHQDASGSMAGNFPLVFVCAGSWEAVRDAFDAAAIGGTVVLMAYPRRSGVDVGTARLIHQRGLHVVGAVASETPHIDSFDPIDAGDRWLDMCAHGVVTTEGLVTPWNYDGEGLQRLTDEPDVYEWLQQRRDITHALKWSDDS